MDDSDADSAADSEVPSDNAASRDARTPRQAASLPGAVDEVGADVNEDPALLQARAALRIKSVNDACIAIPMDSVEVDKLITLRFATPTRMVKSVRQQLQFRVLLEWAFGQVADALRDCRDASADHASRGGNGSEFRIRTANRTAVRAYKFLHLLPALAFAYQHGLDTGIGEPQVGPGTRLQSISDGRIADLLAAVLVAAEVVPAQRSRAPDPTAAGAEWTEEDARLQKLCATISGQRNGIGLAARRLEQQAGSSPRNEDTLDALTGKHPAPGTRQRVSDTPHDTVRRLVSEARTRTRMVAPKSPLLSEVRRRLAERDKRRAAGQRSSNVATDGSGNPGFLAASNMFQPIKVTGAGLQLTLRRAAAGKAAGLGGLRYEHLWLATGSTAAATAAEDEARVHGAAPLVLELMADMYNFMLATPELVPTEIQRLFQGGTLSGVGPKGRPIAVGDTCRRFLCAYLAQEMKDLGGVLREKSQFGFGTPSGTEHVAMDARLWHELGVGGSLLLLDCENAFNSMDRATIIAALERFEPRLLPLFDFLYCGETPPELRVELRCSDGAEEDTNKIVLSQLGCQQGDPLGPLWFALGVTHLLHPAGLDPAVPHGPGAAAAKARADCHHRGDTEGEGDDDGAGADAGFPPPDPQQAPPPPHAAYLDDITLRLAPGFGQEALAQVQEVERRLAAGGLKIRLDKCLAVAPRGEVFTAQERRRLQRLGIPFTDASLSPEERGFTIVGVPVGEGEYIEQHLRRHLFDETLWRLGWQLVGMARTNFPAALRIFRGSFTQRFMYLARNVDPTVSATYCGGFDGLCAWALERLLHLDGAATAADMETFLRQACERQDAFMAANDGPLVLPTLGPQGIAGTYGTPGLPLRVARFSPSSGGMQLPQLHQVCRAAFVGQLITTLCPRVIAMHADLRLDNGTSAAAGAPPPTHGPSDELPPLLRAARRELRHWTEIYEAAQRKSAAAAGELPVSQRTQRDDDGDVVMNNASQRGPRADTNNPSAWAPPPDLTAVVPEALLHWAHQPDPTVNSALAAVARAATSSPIKNLSEKYLCEARIAAARQFHGVDAGDSSVADGTDEAALLLAGLGPLPVQRRLTAVLVDTQIAQLNKDLQKSGRAGKLVMAQLRSQRGPGAMEWLRAQPGRINSTNAVIMVLVALMVDAFRVSGTTCPYSTHCGAVDGPTCVHAIGCPHQNIRGHNATHTQQKRAVQRVLTRSNAAWWSNEDRSPFNRPGFKMDTVLAPGALSLASDEEFALKGVLLDTTVRAPTVAKYLEAGKDKKGSAYESGFAAKEGSKEKDEHYKGTFNADRWMLVPFAQESFGRFGEAALKFINVVASHSAACRGGNKKVIKRRAGIISRQIRAEMSLSLARELSERVCAYVRGAIMTGRISDPVSALLRP